MMKQHRLVTVRPAGGGNERQNDKKQKELSIDDWFLKTCQAQHNSALCKTKRPLQQENNASTKSFISANAILKVGNTIVSLLLLY